MLIYNHKKEFIGIEEKELKIFGLTNLAQLRSEASDFADLLVKTPGYVHNFQHVHWIDYIACADSTEQPKILINVNGNLFKANASVETTFLADNPTEKAYVINLIHLRVLTDAERASISSDAVQRPVATATEPVEPVSFTNETDSFEQEESFQTPTQTPNTNIILDEYDTAPATPSVEETSHEEEPLDVDMDYLDVSDVVDDSFEQHEDFASQEEFIPTPEPTQIQTNTQPPKQEPKPEPVVVDEAVQQVLNDGYIYNPQIASDQLGLPLDLIEEFIEDFINQSKDFKPNLYAALDEGDIENVKILSHKLKGVAANLRIEDALEVLTTVNTTSDLNVIQKNLDLFYVIIAKLSGELPTQQEVQEPQQEQPEEINFEEEITFAEDEITLADTDEITLADEDEITLADADEITLADTDEITISDEDVPEQISLAELADDNFIAQDELNVSQEDTTLQDTKALPQIYSKQSIAQAIGLDVQGLNELIEEFNTEANEIISTIKMALQNSDLILVKRQATQLQGMSDNLRFSNLSKQIQVLLDAKYVADASKELSTIEDSLAQISFED